MARQRPFGITLLAVLAGISAVIALIHTLQMLHLFPVSIGPIRFFTFDLLGALLWGINFLVWLWVARMLWNVEPQGWTFIVLLSSFNLILALITIFGATTLQDMLPSILVNGGALLYALSSGVKRAFGVAT
jgi:hypothetical protein